MQIAENWLCERAVKELKKKFAATQEEVGRKKGNIDGKSENRKRNKSAFSVILNRNRIKNERVLIFLQLLLRYWYNYTTAR